MKFPNRRFRKLLWLIFSFFFFTKCQKVKYHCRLSINPRNFIPPVVFIYKFCNKHIFIQPPEKPRDIIKVKFDQKSSSYKKVEKLNISSLYFSIIIIFSMNLHLVFIYKFRKKDIQLQPPGEPREHRLDEVLQGRSK